MTILTEIQSELKAPKTQFNKFGGYNYRNCEDILEAVKPLLLKHDAYILISDKIVNLGDRYYIQATAHLQCGDNSWEVTAYARESESRKGMDDAQLTGATSSYARKYALNGLLLIDDARDADATNKHEKNGNEKETTTNFKFLKAMGELKKEVGDEVYYEVLGLHGYTSSKEIIKRSAQENIYAILASKAKKED